MKRQTFIVETCTARRGKGFMATYRYGKQTRAAYSDRELREGQSITVIDGVVQ